MSDFLQSFCCGFFRIFQSAFLDKSLKDCKIKVSFDKLSLLNESYSKTPLTLEMEIWPCNVLTTFKLHSTTVHICINLFAVNQQPYNRNST